MFQAAIIVPSWHYFADPFKLQPLNELYFATIIDDHFKDKAVKTNVFDLRQLRKSICRDTRRKINSYIPQQDIYLYWIAKTADYCEISSVVKELRFHYPEAKHVAGGTHVDNFPEICKDFFDTIVTGPGEESFIKIINDAQGGSLKKVYKSDWDSAHFADYPFPKRTYLPEDAIVNTVLFEKYGAVRGTSAIFSRGCNFKCAYCVYNVPQKIQMRKPESIEQEIQYLKDTYQIEGVNLRDEICLPLSPRVAIPYLEAIGHTNLIWRGQTRVGAGREIVALARQTGCVELAVGVESASQQVLDIIAKGQVVQQARDFIYNCKLYGIKVKMCLILGLPGEPPDIVDITRRFIEETQPDYVNISGLCPVPGSEIFNNKQYYGIKYIDEDWSRHAHLVFRYSDEEHFGLPFEYNEVNQWGKTFSRAEIISNIKQLQHYLQEKNMVY